MQDHHTGSTGFSGGGGGKWVDKHWLGQKAAKRPSLKAASGSWITTSQPARLKKEQPHTTLR